MFSTPAKVAAARRKPPTWSALMGGSSEMRDWGLGGAPAGRLWGEKDSRLPFAKNLILADSLIAVYFSSEAPRGFGDTEPKFTKTIKQLTVLQSQHRTIAAGARRSPGSHQTAGKTGTFELEGKREGGGFRRMSEQKRCDVAPCAVHDTHLRLPSTRLGSLPPS